MALLSIIVGALFGSGCSTLTTPVLTHETGEALGAGKFRLRGTLESSRMFALIPMAVQQRATTDQESSIFQGGFLSVGGAAGITPRWDVQLGTYFTFGGAGWRFGNKLQWLQRGNWASAVMLGYGRFSSKGTETITTTTGPVDVTQTLSAYHIDLSFPVSYRFTKSVALYSGLNYYRSGVTGSADNNAVSSTTNDIGTNFGVKLSFGRFEGDIEIAVVRLYDPIADGMRLVPFWGISGGIVF